MNLGPRKERSLSGRKLAVLTMAAAKFGAQWAVLEFGPNGCSKLWVIEVASNGSLKAIHALDMCSGKMVPMHQFRKHRGRHCDLRVGIT